MAKLKITTGRLAMGRDISKLVNWLLSAVNKSGAVSPLTRATASKMPVTMPLRAARTTTAVDTFHCGAPKATAASRNVDGTSCNMFSVVRTTTGKAISAKATDPAHPEKRPVVATNKA